MYIKTLILDQKKIYLNRKVKNCLLTRYQVQVSSRKINSVRNTSHRDVSTLQKRLETVEIGVNIIQGWKTPEIKLAVTSVIHIKRDVYTEKS